MKRKYFLVIVAICFETLHSDAQIIFKESFNYPVGNLQGSNGGVGFSTMWSQNGTDATTPAATTSTQIVTGSINSIFGQGNRVQATLENNKTIRFDRTLAASTLNVDAQEYWLSFWYRSTSTHDLNTAGVAAQIVLMNGENGTIATDMRLGFGKTSNYTSNVAPLVPLNCLTAFTRANASCAAANWPSSQTAAAALNITSQSTYFILVKISKREFVDLNTATLPTSTLGTFDGVRVWFLTQPPSGSSDPIFTNKPAGDITTIDPNTAATLPILARVLRGGADNTAYNTSCKKDGITGLRIRLEGNSGVTHFNVEFDEITLSTTLDALLPATFNSLTAKENFGANNLAFSTINETNVKEFNIEKSKNGITFYKVATLPAKNNQSNYYSYTDVEPSVITYYRIKVIDKDGKMAYSDIIHVKRNELSEVVIFPNPTKNNLTLNIHGSSLNAENKYIVTTLEGKQIISAKFNGNHIKININNLATGYYLVETLQNNKRISIQKIYKN